MDYLITGTLNYDITLFVTSIPKPGGETKVTRIKRALGGKGGNVASAFAKIVGKASFLGALGDDEAARLHLNYFKGLNVNTDYVKIFKDVESGTSYVVVDEKSGENMIISYPGANSKLTPEIIDEKLLNELQNTKIVVAANVVPEFAQKVFSASKGVKIYIPATHVKNSCQVNADYFIVNESESEHVKECKGPKIIRTLGKKGAEIFGERVHVEAVNLEKLGMKPQSSAGAGDAFAGAFAAALALGYGEEDSLKLANYAAAYKVAHEDPRGSPSKEDLIKFLRQVDPKFNLEGLSASLV
ncbi:MAG: PfkB family carbohydrate kinase [Nitrososphaeria archaeon]|nr:PfkB family carbohydrate kinase [Conexivisphaerales archaeon]